MRGKAWMPTEMNDYLCNYMLNYLVHYLCNYINYLLFELQLHA